jgi:hypothetical protein
MRRTGGAAVACRPASSSAGDALAPNPPSSPTISLGLSLRSY